MGLVLHVLILFRTGKKPQNKEQLISGIQEFWRDKMTVAQCRRYIEHIHNAIKLVIEAKGGMTKG